MYKARRQWSIHFEVKICAFQKWMSMHEKTVLWKNTTPWIWCGFISGNILELGEAFARSIRSGLISLVSVLNKIKNKHEWVHPAVSFKVDSRFLLRSTISSRGPSLEKGDFFCWVNSWRPNAWPLWLGSEAVASKHLEVDCWTGGTDALGLSLSSKTYLMHYVTSWHGVGIGMQQPCCQFCVTWPAQVKKRTPLKYLRIDQFFLRTYINQAGMLPTQFPGSM